MTAKKTAYEITAKTIISNLAKRNIEGFYFSDKEQLMNQIFLIYRNKAASHGAVLKRSKK